MITYSTNMMGPWSMGWYFDRGLTRKATKVVEEGSILVKLKKRRVGEVIRYDEITTHYSGGRIDIYGVPNEPYPLEYSLPIMRTEDWNDFSEWLDTLETEELLSFDEIIELYGKPIRWWKEWWKEHDE